LNYDRLVESLQRFTIPQEAVDPTGSEGGKNG
jgi:hypothetical protein